MLVSLVIWCGNYENDVNESLFFRVYDKILKNIIF